MWFRRSKSSKNIVLIQTHRLDTASIDLYHAIQSDLPEGFVVKILLHDEEGVHSPSAHGLPDEAVVKFNLAQILTMGIPFLRGTLMP